MHTEAATARVSLHRKVKVADANVVQLDAALSVSGLCSRPQSFCQHGVRSLAGSLHVGLVYAHRRKVSH